MNRKSLILFLVLAIFVVGMTMGCATSKTVTLKTKKDKYVTKKKGKYTVETFKWKSGTYQELDIFVYKNGKMLNKNKFKSKYYYKYNGKWKSMPWRHGSVDCTYHKYHTDKSVKIGKVKVRY